MDYLETNIRFILGQNYLSSTEFYELVSDSKKITYELDHEKFDMAGNRDSNSSYLQNIKVLKLFPELPLKVRHDYISEFNDYYKPTHWLYFHKGQILFENHKFEEIADLSGYGTVYILKYLIMYFGIEKYFKSPFDLINK